MSAGACSVGSMSGKPSTRLLSAVAKRGNTALLENPLVVVEVELYDGILVNTIDQNAGCQIRFDREIDSQSQLIRC